MRISDWSSDVCSSDLPFGIEATAAHEDAARHLDHDIQDGFEWRCLLGRGRRLLHHAVLHFDDVEADHRWRQMGKQADLDGLGGKSSLHLRQRKVPVEPRPAAGHCRSEENTSALQSLIRTSYAVLCLKKK